MLKRDDLSSWKEELKGCLQNLEDYRQHLVHKHDEDCFDSSFYSGLAEDECIVIWDYKMKVHPSFHREGQRGYFGKRGFSLLGALVLTPTDNPEKLKAQFHFFIR